MFASFGPGSLTIIQELRGEKCIGRVVVVIVESILEIRVKAIDGALCRMLTVGGDVTSCIVTRVWERTVHAVGIRGCLAVS